MLAVDCSQVVWKGSEKHETIIHHVCQHGKTWPYWFKKTAGVLKQLGSYSLQLQAVLSDGGSSTYVGGSLPGLQLGFTIKGRLLHLSKPRGHI